MAIGEYIPNLLPCPFCGGAAAHDTRVEGNSNGPDADLVTVGCEACGIVMERYVTRHTTGESVFVREGKGKYSDFWTLPITQRIDWDRQAANRNASYDIEGYLELEKMWNKRAR